MQSSLLQTGAFALFMLSVYTVASMLPCGRYYYEPEGGYVGNPWVKVSFQYLYLYLGWLIHNLDLIEYFIFRFLVPYISQRLSKAQLQAKRRLAVWEKLPTKYKQVLIGTYRARLEWIAQARDEFILRPEYTNTLVVNNWVL